MKKRILFLAAAFLAVSTATFAAENYNVSVNGTQITSENASTYSSQGISYDPSTKTLTLNNATISVTDKDAIEATNDLTIVLVGANTITATGSNSNGVFVSSGSLTIQGGGSLEITTSGYNGDGIFASDGTNGNITIGGNAKLTITTSGSNGDGINAYGGTGVTIAGGSAVEITTNSSNSSAIWAANGGVVVNDGSSVTATTKTTADNSYGIYAGGAAGVTIAGGKAVNITTSGSKGIYAKKRQHYHHEYRCCERHDQRTKCRRHLHS